MAEVFDAAPKRASLQLLAADLPLPPEMTRPPGQTTPNIGQNDKPNDHSGFAWGGDILARLVGTKVSLSAANRTWGEPFSKVSPDSLSNVWHYHREATGAGIPLQRLSGTDEAIVGQINRQLTDPRLEAQGMRLNPTKWTEYKDAATAFRNDQALHSGFMPRAIGSILAAEVGKIAADGLLFPKEAPGGLTMMVDLLSPAVIVSQLAWRYKIGAMIGAHVLARFAEK